MEGPSRPAISGGPQESVSQVEAAPLGSEKAAALEGKAAAAALLLRDQRLAHLEALVERLVAGQQDGWTARPLTDTSELNLRNAGEPAGQLEEYVQM